MKDAQKSAKTGTAVDESSEGWTDDERAAMKERNQDEPRRRHHVANFLGARGLDRRRRGKDRRAREESGELRTELAAGPALGRGPERSRLLARPSGCQTQGRRGDRACANAARQLLIVAGLMLPPRSLG